MDDVESRVRECFSAVFPDLAEDAIPTLRQETFGAWDSVAHATLIATLSETFDVELDFEAFAEATTFARVLECVRAVGVAGAG